MGKETLNSQEVGDHDEVIFSKTLPDSMMKLTVICFSNGLRNFVAAHFDSRITEIQENHPDFDIKYDYVG